MAMADRNDYDQVRSLIDQIDLQLRHAERLRRYVHRHPESMWPDRRRMPRVPDVTDETHSDCTNAE
jgi:hypothetical protein